MKLSLVTVALDAESEAFPRSPLAEIEGEIVSVVEHFFHFDGLPRLLLVVHHRNVEARRKDPAKTNRRDDGPRSQLIAEERELYDRLRTWRAGRAQADAVPPYVVLTNAQLAEIARRRPATLAALSAIEGIGEGKLGKFGQEILAVVAHVG